VSGHPSPGSRLGGVGAALFFGLATLGAVQFLRPEGALTPPPLTNLANAMSVPAASLPPTASPAADAFGESGEVKVRFALPGEHVEFPIAIAGSSDSLAYQWVNAVDQTTPGPARPLTAAPTIAPHGAGFYHLAVIRGDTREVLSEPTLVVMVPFDHKLGDWVNGYRIGTYLSERFGGYDRPVGFIEVTPSMLDLAITKHLKLSDFVTHDDQGDVWPKYVALNPRLLDKLELVFADLGSRVRPGLAVDMHSGFRSPSHNSRVERAARDSRHQYGDAADLAIDADGDGRITMTDELLVMLAVERVESAHPDLVGGLGLYTSRRYRTPYVHIDARGKRTRWQG